MRWILSGTSDLQKNHHEIKFRLSKFEVSPKFDPGRICFCISFIVFVLIAGCSGSDLRRDPLPSDLNQSAHSFVESLGNAFRAESRSQLFNMVDERYGKHVTGGDNIIERTGNIFDQYQVMSLNIKPGRVTSFDDSVTVMTEWTLQWKCQQSNPDRGCPDLSDKNKFPVQVRRGETSFELKWKAGQWKLHKQRGNVLIGMFEPGDLIREYRQ